MKIPALFIKIVSPSHKMSLQTMGNIYGACLSLLVMVMRSGASSIVHSLPKTLSSIQILFIESAFIFLFLCGIWSRVLKQTISSKKPFLHMAKAGCNIVGTFFLFEALKALPLALSSTLSLASVIFSVVGSFLFFHEKPNFALILGILLSLLGFVCIAQWTFTCFSIAFFFPLISALSFSISTLISKEIALFDSLKTSIFWTFMLQTITMAGPCYYVWQPINLIGVEQIFITATILLISFPLTLQAESFAASAFLAPFKCTRIFLSLFLGWLFFNETVSYIAWFGMFCIISSHLVLWKNNNRITSYYIREKGKAAFDTITKK